MKRINKNELPEILTDEVINILIEMALEEPKETFDWAEVSELLDKRGELTFILNKVHEAKKKLNASKNNEIRNKHIEIKNGKDFDKYDFFGNMGEPLSINEYKERYGFYPKGYDERIVPNELPSFLTSEQVDLIANIYIEYQCPQYWIEIFQVLKNNKTNQLERIFSKVKELTGENFPMHKPLGKLNKNEFKTIYGFYPPN